jgi:hypothetical protein
MSCSRLIIDASLGAHVRQRTEGIEAQDLQFERQSLYAGRTPMGDMYVYHFMRRGPAGENILSRRWATLETINGMGEAVMESQIVVDHTEVDGNGYLVGRSGNEAHPTDELWAQIRSLERRANSRDIEALALNESGEGARSYLLRLESRELRKQAQRLRKQGADSMVGELGNRIDSQVFVEFQGDPTMG